MPFTIQYRDPRRMRRAHFGPFFLSLAPLVRTFLVLQCHFDLGYELSASLAVPERFHYPLPEAFLAPLAVASVHRSPRPELLFRQITPRRSCPQNPQHPSEYLTMIASGPSCGRLLRGH